MPLNLNWPDAKLTEKMLDSARSAEGLWNGGCYESARNVRALLAHIEEMRKEIERLKRGDFTEEEFQNLCHNFSKDDACRFQAGCDEYQKKLFGRDALTNQTSRMFAQVFQTYLECSDEVQEAIRDMVRIVNAPDATDDEREAAVVTIAYALFPEKKIRCTQARGGDGLS